MAISILNSYDTFYPAYDPNVFIIDSDNKAEQGFRYIVRVYDYTTNVLLFTKKYPPRPADGYAEVHLEREMQSYVSGRMMNKFYGDATTSYKRFKIKFGEEFINPWEFTTITSVSGFPGSLRLNGSTAHGLSVGDQINVTQANNQVIGLNGLQTVVMVPSTTSIILNVPYMSTPGTDEGYLVLANNAKEEFFPLETINDYTIFNGVFTLRKQYPGESAYDINYTAGDALFLTNMPNTMRIKEGMPIFLNWFNNYTARTTSDIFAYWFNSNGDIFKQQFSLANTTGVAQTGFTSTFCSIFYGATALSGTFPLVKPTTEYYEFELRNGDGDTLTERKRVYINHDCTISNVYIMFMDRLGSWTSFPFWLRTSEKGTINKLTYNKRIDAYLEEPSAYVEYPQDSAGLTTYYVDVEKTFTLNTDWLNQDEIIYFQELLTSPFTRLFIEDPADNGNLKALACQVQDTNMDIENLQNKKLIKKTITVKLSVNENVNI